MSQDKQPKNNDAESAVAEPKKIPVCGIIRPISAMEGYSEQHWKDVAIILNEAVEDAGFEAKLVSDAAEVSVIQKNIVQNLYECPIIICDVSGKNANVMFELGLRLAFDKPTIIIKDDKTDYNFDTSVIEHLHYPKTLHYGKIQAFKGILAEKLSATYKTAQKDKKYSPFLRHFGQLIPAKIEKQEVSEREYIQENFLEKIIEVIDTRFDQRDAIERQRRERHLMRRRHLFETRHYANDERKQILMQKFSQAQAELRHMDSTKSFLDKKQEIEKLEALLASLDNS